MKRWISASLIMLTLALSIFAHADSSATITNVPGAAPFDVDGTYIPSTTENMHFAPIIEGEYVVSTEKEEIRLNPKEEKEEMQLVVHFFDDEHEEAQDWLEECIKGLETESRPFEIYYTDNQGGNKRIELDEGDEISLKLPDPEKEYVVVRLAYDGSKTIVESTVKDGFITFRVGGTKCYFALAEKSKTDLPVEPDKPQEPDQPIAPDQPSRPDEPTTPDQPQKPDKEPESPDTGNGFNLIFWIAVGIASGSALAIALLLRKKEEE